MVKIKFLADEATLDNGQWSCTDPELDVTLNVLRPPNGIPASEPNNEYALAEYVAGLLGGEIIEADEVDYEQVDADGNALIY